MNEMTQYERKQGLVAHSGKKIIRPLSVYIHPEAKIHPTVEIGPSCTIGKCEIGENTRIYAFSCIKDGSVIGKNVIIHEFCSVGSEQFTFPRDADGKLHHQTLKGRAIIEDDLELFPHVNVDLGTERDTRVGEGSKIDHHCHIGHDAIVGKHCVVTAHVVFGGFASLGDYSYIGLGCMLKPRITIGSDCLIGMGSIVTKDIEDCVVAYGNPARVKGENERGYLYQQRMTKG